MADRLPEEKLAVQIGDWTYSLVKVPSEDSAIVKGQEGRLLGAVDLKSLVQGFRRVGKFIRIAYNAIRVAGSKDEFVELQIRIQDLGYDITKLCDKSAITVAKFKKASGSILVNLQCTYEYLLDNLEEMAVETLSPLSKLAGSMAKAADELHEDFERQGEKVEKTLKDILDEGEQKRCESPRKVNEQENMAEAAVYALHEAMRGLKQLSLIMMKAAIFWKQMQMHCQSFAESEMQDQVERALKLSEQKRLKVWTSKGFKIKAVEFYAEWVALKCVCAKYIDQIKLAQRELYEFLKEHLTYEQSRRLVPELAT